jgi:putative resolvase
MKNKRLLSPKEAASALGISIRTLYRWEAAGNLSAMRTVGNQRRISIAEIARLRRQGKGKPGAERCVLYARVSSVSQEQDGTLTRQTERLREAVADQGYEVVAVITEHASSLNERRRGMKQLLALVGEQATDVVLLEYPDRLVHFGFSYLEQAFGWMGVQLEVFDPPKQWQPAEEVVQDVLTIVTVFAGRLYRHRARGIRSRVQTALKDCEQTAQATTGELYGTSQQDHQTAS